MQYTLRPDSPSDFTLTTESTKRLARDVTELWFSLPDGSQGFCASPGQFAHFEAGTFLRRPISLAGWNRDRGAVRVIVQSVGSGSRALSELSPGERVRALMPLGNPFPMSEAIDNLSGGGSVWLVGGGIGIAPLLFCAQSLRQSEAAWRSGARVRIFAGFRSDELVFGTKEAGDLAELSLCIGGFVTDDVAEALRDETPGLIMACGPTPMLRALKAICGDRGIRTMASLEEHMGCGIGACLVCSCATQNGDYKRVCCDGPVFDLSEIVP